MYTQCYNIINKRKEIKNLSFANGVIGKVEKPKTKKIKS